MLKSAFVIVQRLLSVFPRICLMVQKNVSNLRQWTMNASEVSKNHKDKIWHCHDLLTLLLNKHFGSPKYNITSDIFNNNKNIQILDARWCISLTNYSCFYVFKRSLASIY